MTNNNTNGNNSNEARRRRVIFLLLVSLALALALFMRGTTSFSSLVSFPPLHQKSGGGNKRVKDEGLLHLRGADDAGFLNPDEEESTKVAVANNQGEEEEPVAENVLEKLGDEVEDEDKTDDDDDDDDDDVERYEAETKQVIPNMKKATITRKQRSFRRSSHSHACSPEYISLFPPKAKATKALVSTLAHKKNYENTGAYRDKKIPASILPNSGRDILAAPAVVANNLANGEAPWQTCALVGNSGHLLKMDYGKQIDANDIVVRINQAPTKGYEKYVGKRTTHRLLNRLWTIAYHDGSGINKIYRGGGWPLEKGVTLISSRTAAENFVRLAYYVKNKLKRKDVQTLFLMPEVRAVAENSLKKFRKCYEKKHSKNFRGGNCASSGLVGIAMLRPLCLNITVYGLGKGQRGDPYQYYRLKQTHRSYGNPVHSFDTEDIMFRTMANDRVITFCNAKDGCF